MDPDTEILGHSGCAYTGSKDGPGFMECDDVPRFNCLEHGDIDEEIVCSDDPIFTAEYKRRVRCIFLNRP
ncbi:hypothetical protein F4808DRAFT_421157 [Astrocystis sublimbata]|nr:hypothetical protein F4808DRAFT_421157 [Astrocystis sublimbata]